MTWPSVPPGSNPQQPQQSMPAWAPPSGPQTGPIAPQPGQAPMEQQRYPQHQQQYGPPQGHQGGGFQPPPPRQMSNTTPFLIPRRPVPTMGWRKVVYKLTGGRWNPGLSALEREQLELRQAVTRPLHGIRRIAVMSRKGGVGKTTTTIGLGSTLAVHRGDRVVALDSNPDAGDLAERIQADNPATIRDLIDGAAAIGSYTDMRRYTSQAGSRMEVIAADQDPEISEAFNESEYRQVQDVLGAYYNIILSDCGTGVLHSAMNGVLATADDLVIVVGLTVSGARKASQTLDWLEKHGHQELARNSIAVISPVVDPEHAKKSSGADTPHVDRAAVRAFFEDRCRAVIDIPHDPHLAPGEEVRLDELAMETQIAYLRLAAAIAERFDAS